MKRFKFNKPLIESKNTPENTNVYWVDINELSGKVESIKEFKDNKWVSILGIDSTNIQDIVGAVITENGEFTIQPDAPYTAMKEVQLNVHIDAESAQFTTLSYFGDVLTLVDGSTYTVGMQTPITDNRNVAFPIKALVGTTQDVVYGTIDSYYNSVAGWPEQIIRFSSSTAVAKQMRHYENGQWTDWAL